MFDRRFPRFGEIILLFAAYPAFVLAIGFILWLVLTGGRP